MDAASALLIESGSPASRANSRLVPSGRQPQTCTQTLGRGAVPMFFWGGEATRGMCVVGIVLEPDGCLARFGSQPVQRRNGCVPGDVVGDHRRDRSKDYERFIRNLDS